jgi:hypothetical protein
VAILFQAGGFQKAGAALMRSERDERDGGGAMNSIARQWSTPNKAAENRRR